VYTISFTSPFILCVHKKQAKHFDINAKLIFFRNQPGSAMLPGAGIRAIRHTLDYNDFDP